MLGIGAALEASIAIAPPVAAQQTAESIWSGGPSLTMNDKAMRAEAVAVANGKILAVGQRSEVMKLKGPQTQLVDLKGRTLVPGDVVEIEIEGIGVLRNPVVAEDRVNVRAMAKVDQTPSR